jgi:hypothetical protein
LADGQRTLGEIAAELRHEFDGVPDNSTVEQDAIGFAMALVEKGLLEVVEG